MPDLADHDADPGDHDRPIPVITMDRSGCSRSAETRTSDGLPGAPAPNEYRPVGSSRVIQGFNSSRSQERDRES